MGQIDIEYKKLVETVLSEGASREDRTGVGTRSIFGYQYEVNLMLGFPLLTTKRINYANIYHELCWMLRGETNINTLKAPQLWKPWADEAGELGEIYGQMWRDWGACPWYPGIDQIKTLIEELKDFPFSRRHVVSAWNPFHNRDRPNVPNACHTMFQCYVQDVGKGRFLDLQLYQRSGDLALGVPYNIAFYATLMKMLGQECGMIPRRFIHTLGDAHIYNNHIDKLKEQIEREPRESPNMQLMARYGVLMSERSKIGFWNRIKRDTEHDVILTGYHPYPAVSFKVSV